MILLGPIFGALGVGIVTAAYLHSPTPIGAGFLAGTICLFVVNVLIFLRSL